MEILFTHKCRKCERDLDDSHYTMWLSIASGEPFRNGNQTCNSCRIEASNRFSLLQNPPGWMENAACRGENPDLWFADMGTNDAWKAARICHGCPVKALCGSYAASTRSEGIWGGDLHAFFNGSSPKPPKKILEPTIDELKPLRRRGRKTALERGICAKGLHRILSEDDLILRTRGEITFHRCAMCDKLANTREQKSRREREGRVERQKYAPGVKCKNGHLMTEETFYRAKVKVLVGGKTVLKEQSKCRECDREAAARLRRKRGQVEGRGKGKGRFKNAQA